MNSSSTTDTSRYHYMRCLGLVEAIKFYQRLNLYNSHYQTLLNNFESHESKVTPSELEPKSKNRFFHTQDYFRSIQTKKPETSF